MRHRIWLFVLACSLGLMSPASSKSPIASSLKLMDQTELVASYQLTRGSHGRFEPSTPSDYQFIATANDLFMTHLVWFVQKPELFAHFFPAEFTFLYKYGILQSNYLDGYLVYDVDHYGTLAEIIAMSPLARYFTQPTDFWSAAYIDYIYCFNILDIDIAPNGSDGQLLTKTQYLEQLPVSADTHEIEGPEGPTVPPEKIEPADPSISPDAGGTLGSAPPLASISTPGPTLPPSPGGLLTTDPARFGGPIGTAIEAGPIGVGGSGGTKVTTSPIVETSGPIGVVGPVGSTGLSSVPGMVGPMGTSSFPGPVGPTEPTFGSGGLTGPTPILQNPIATSFDVNITNQNLGVLLTTPKDGDITVDSFGSVWIYSSITGWSLKK